MARDIFQIEIAHENPATKGYFYSYLDLPAPAHRIRDTLQKARITGSGDGYYEINITNSPYLYDLKDVRLDSPSIDELNFLAKRIQAMDGMERLTYEAVIQKVIDNGEPVSMKDLINCTYNLDEVPVAAGVANDAQLGEFIIENEMHEDVNAVPENSVYLLDRTKVGELYRTTFGTVYENELCIFAGDYEMPEVYDGKQLPEESPSQWFAFRLLVADAPEEDETESNTEWISLPMSKKEANRIAQLHGANCIEDCVYYDFDSAVPQITSEMFDNMADFDKLNRLAIVMAEMSPLEQVKFKAVLYAEKPVGIVDALDIAEHLHQYEMDTTIADDGAFFKSYLAHHLDTRFDMQWLDSLLVRAEGGRLLDRLGAMVTDYGAISSRGNSLYMLVPYDKLAARKLTTQALTDEKLEVVEVLGQTALFTNGRVTQDELPDGLYMYHIRQGEGMAFATIESHVEVNHGGTMLFKAPLDFGGMKYFVFDEDSSPNFLGYELTPTEFMETDFSQTEDEPEQTAAPQLGGM